MFGAPIEIYGSDVSNSYDDIWVCDATEVPSPKQNMASPNKTLFFSFGLGDRLVNQEQE